MRFTHRAATVSAVALSGLVFAAPAMAATSVGVGSGTGTNVNVNTNVSVPAPFLSAGTVVSTATGSVTVKQLGGGNATYAVADKAVITLDGRTVALSALPAGTRIVVVGTATNGVSSARVLTALSRWDLNLSGTVAAVDAAKGTVTVNNGSTAVKLNVDPKASVQLNGAKISLGTLPVGATVNLTGSQTATTATVAGINASLGSNRARA